MNLVDLVSLFRRGETFEGFCEVQGLDESAEVIEIYAREPADLKAELRFFPIEESKGQVRFQWEGQLYQSLFDFFYFLDAMEEVQDSKLSDFQVAQKLFDYAMKDA
jgi:hypothetical protein